MGTVLLMLGLLGAWSADGVRDGFHVAQTAQKTWYPHTYGAIVDYHNYHDFVTVETASVALAGAGTYLWSKQNPEWWRVAGVTMGTSLVGWMAREWLIDYVPTGDAFRESEPWQSEIFGHVDDNGLTFQLAVGAAGAGLVATSLLLHGPDHAEPYQIHVVPTAQGLDVAINF